MLTVSDRDEDLFDALRAGASGYLLKDTDPERLPHALRGVASGESAMPRHLVARLMDQFRASHGRRLPGRLKRRAELTSREDEVLDLLVEGHSTHQMAERLFISQVTVRSHVAAILKKLDVPNRDSAVRLLKDDEHH
jgi:DNA-binding NarL/FixJ family response regulator